MTGGRASAPHDLDAERHLLGAMMISTEAIASVNGLTSGDFYKPAHGHVFDAIRALHAAALPAEPVTVADQLRRSGLLDTIGGHGALVQIMSSTPSTSSASVYAKIIDRKARARDAVALAGTIADLARDEKLEAVHQALAEAVAGAVHRQPVDHVAAGGDWLLDQPAGVPAVWGDGDEVLMAQGESLLLCGPPGVGKTTLAGQLLWARLGLRVEVLGWPVAPTSSKVLYLAMDRPRQIRRAFGRLVCPDERDILNERLVVREGPPPQDLARHPHVLAELAAHHDADTVFIDSLKDAAIGLVDDDVGSGYNRARQTATAAGVELVELHHQRKAQNGTKPTKLEDVYGSTWITAGAGSVILLWGQPGDPLVELTHLKQPAAVVGPHQIAHDHATGTSLIEGRFDILTFLRRQPAGTDADAAARARYSTASPTENNRRVVRKQLDRLVAEGLARKIDAVEGGPTGTQPARWYPVDHHRESEF